MMFQLEIRGPGTAPFSGRRNQTESGNHVEGHLGREASGGRARGPSQ